MREFGCSSTNPSLAKTLERNGSLEATARDKERLAETEEEQLLSAMLERSPLPNDPPLARVEHYARLRRRAEEIAQAHLLEEIEASAGPDTSAEAQTDGRDGRAP